MQEVPIAPPKPLPPLPKTGRIITNAKPITTTTNTTTHLPPSQYPVSVPESGSTSTSTSTTTTSNLSTTAQKGSDTNFNSLTPTGVHTPPPIDTIAGNTREGLGILPGAKSESGVAILPDERNIIDSSPNNRSTDGGGVGDLPGSRSETNVAVLPEERAQTQIEVSRTPLSPFHSPPIPIARASCSRKMNLHPHQLLKPTHLPTQIPTLLRPPRLQNLLLPPPLYPLRTPNPRL